ncbi:discoidin domain-containing protein [Clostridium estertheticum]|uniref:discoidin domain-containing protein n=1 Tax=Clostridium estertheticum TaxID=238834 RepID=UPI0013E92AA2|nr:discoidin domain-containing protein [Clostridium estertheticum]MBZ9686743.1 discoidin domain-containing protein [Clostridium estertheticum]
MVASEVGIGGSGVLATVRLRSKTDGIVNLKLESSTIIGTNLDVVNAISSEPSNVNELAFELKIPQSQMEATATAEETQSEDCSASNVLDGNVETYWNIPWDKSGILPQSLVIDLGDTFEVSKIVFLYT